MPFVYMASALLLKNKIPAQSHNGVVGQIGLYFVTTGRLSKENCSKCLPRFPLTVNFHQGLCRGYGGRNNPAGNAGKIFENHSV